MDKDDPLLKKAREAESRANRAAAQAADVSENKRFLGDTFFLVKMWLTLKRFWGVRLLSAIVVWLFTTIFMCLKWASFARADGDFVRDEDSDMILSPKRFLVVTSCFTGGLFLTHVLLSAIYFYTTKFEELVYTTGKQEIATGELYQFTGCTSLPCSTDAGNGKFYQIEGSWYFPYLVYPEEDVYANIPQQDGACHARGYGFYIRELKALHRRLQWYQHVYNISCRPYTEEEKQRAVNSGKIPVLPEIQSAQ